MGTVFVFGIHAEAWILVLLVVSLIAARRDRDTRVLWSIIAVVCALLAAAVLVFMAIRPWETAGG